MISEENNEIFLSKIAGYLNACPDAVDARMVFETAEELKISSHEAYLLLLSGALDCYEDRTFRKQYLDVCVKHVRTDAYLSDSYRKVVANITGSKGEWELRTEYCKPYELFVCGEMFRTFDGRVLPALAYFTEDFSYPAVFQSGREWMALKPNEIETMKRPVEQAHGDIAVYGLGIGYYAYMASEKENVSRVTVVEKDQDAISLFTEKLLPHFPERNKIRIICEDAFSYAGEGHNHDFVFADLWHDVSDGIPVYRKMKGLERCGTDYAYWIENTMRLYMDSL